MPLDVRKRMLDPWQVGCTATPGDTTARMASSGPLAHVSDITVTVDSVGPGPVIRGHPTVRYRQTEHAAVRVECNALSQTVVHTEGTDEVTIATDIPHAPSIDGLGIERLGAFSLGLALTPALASALRALARGTPRPTTARPGVPRSRGPQTRIVTLETEKWERIPVDASLLEIPAGYTKGMGGMMMEGPFP